jgi:lipopolysaccharide biosynthesis regulator YciM
VPDEVKQATRRTHVFEEGRVAVARNDLATAKAKSAEYARQVAPKKRPFEVRAQHELAGMIALAEKDYATAVTELQAANQQDPRILYFLALATKGAGDTARAAKFATKAANFNGLAFNYAFVRNKARKLSST